MKYTDLGGHSGCKIYLCETDDNNIFVKKISKSIDYNKRLKKQMEKQREFFDPVIKAPQILNEGITEDGFYFFDMEYVNGITLSEYMKRIEVGQIRAIVNTIVNHIIKNQNLKFTDEKIFNDKIKKLRNDLEKFENSKIETAIEKLENHKWDKFVQTSCHGDLTLENIIIKNGDIYFIDFLDSFYDCWIMDISTLLQDVQVMWAYRQQTEMNNNIWIRLTIFNDILVDAIYDVLGSNVLEVYYALLLKLLRIYPYTEDKETYEFLNEKIISVLNIIKEAER